MDRRTKQQAPGRPAPGAMCSRLSAHPLRHQHLWEAVALPSGPHTRRHPHPPGSGLHTKTSPLVSGNGCRDLGNWPPQALQGRGYWLTASCGPRWSQDVVIVTVILIGWGCTRFGGRCSGLLFLLHAAAQGQDAVVQGRIQLARVLGAGLVGAGGGSAGYKASWGDCPLGLSSTWGPQTKLPQPRVHSLKGLLEPVARLALCDSSIPASLMMAQAHPEISLPPGPMPSGQC